MQTFQVCANTDPLGNRLGTFTQNLVINGGQVGPIIVPVNFSIVPVIGGPTVVAGKSSEIGVFRGSAATFFLNESATDSWTPGTSSTNPTADRTEQFGSLGDIPVAGDWDGTGTIRIGVFRPSNGHFYLDMNNNGKWDGTGAGLDADIQFGGPSATCNPVGNAGLSACAWIPVVGDWNGNGVTKLGVFQGGPGKFFLDNQNPILCASGLSNCPGAAFTGSHTSFTTATFGMVGDIPVANNWIGTTTCTVPANGPVVQACDQIGVYRGGTWFANATGDGVFHATDPVYNFGSPADIPVIGNWNSTGGKRIGVFSGLGIWWVDINNDHIFTQPPDLMFPNFGVATDLPVVGTWTLP